MTFVFQLFTELIKPGLQPANAGEKRGVTLLTNPYHSITVAQWNIRGLGNIKKTDIINIS